MFFSKSFIAAATVLLGLTLQANAHAGITPALGVKGTFARGNVQRPSAAQPCGNINVAQNIDASTAITAKADGTFVATVTNFNAGQDGSRQVTAKVDSTGTGKSFTTVATVVQNGDKAPKNVGSQQLTVQLPKGLTCSGGASKNKCVVSFTTAGGFGNCAVVQTAAKKAVAATNTKGRKTRDASAVGSRAARPLRLAAEEEGEEEDVKPKEACKGDCL